MREEINAYALIYGVGYSIWRHNFKTAAMTSFYIKSAATWWVNRKRLPRTYAAAYTSSWSIVQSYLFGSLFVNFLSGSVQYYARLMQTG